MLMSHRFSIFSCELFFVKYYRILQFLTVHKLANLFLNFLLSCLLSDDMNESAHIFGCRFYAVKPDPRYRRSGQHKFSPLGSFLHEGQKC